MTREQLQQRVQDWLGANQLEAHQVQHDKFPLGMVCRWIERAEKAEARVGHLEAECAKLRRLVSEAYRGGVRSRMLPKRERGRCMAAEHDVCRPERGGRNHD